MDAIVNEVTNAGKGLIRGSGEIVQELVEQSDKTAEKIEEIVEK